jgi:hypothetical protein
MPIKGKIARRTHAADVSRRLRKCGTELLLDIQTEPSQPASQMCCQSVAALLPVLLGSSLFSVE